MPSLKSIRKRITSVRSTRKITAAMKLVAGARLRRAQEGIWAARPYAAKMQEVVSELAVRVNDNLRNLATEELNAPLAPLQAEASDETKARYPVIKAAKLLFSRPDEKRVSVVLLTSDRGLCGAFNSNLIRRTDRFLFDNADKFEQVTLNIVGRKGRDYFRRKKANIKRDWSAPQASGSALTVSREIANAVTADFLAGEVDAVYVVYNEFKSAISQRVTVERLLPVSAPPTNGEEHGLGDFKYEPSAEAVLSHLVPLHLQVQLYRALLESIASEFGAKMSAMDSATRSASEMIASLTLQFNRARQAAITKELMEIIGGAEALKG